MADSTWWPEWPTEGSALNPIFEELDFQSTPIGDISLRRRTEPILKNAIVYEVKLDDEFLMSSLFTEAERQLATLALDALDDAPLDVVVGGLGLGYTAAAALDASSIRSLTVIELLEPVIDWHRRGLVPNGHRLTSDPRCAIVRDDFFELAAGAGAGFARSDDSGPVHAVLLDIDHAPDDWLDDKNRTFYSPDGMRSVADKLHPGGVFGLWSNERPDAYFMRLLEDVFESAQSHVVGFANPYTGGESSSTVYVARKSAHAP